MRKHENKPARESQPGKHASSKVLTVLRRSDLLEGRQDGWVARLQEEDDENDVGVAAERSLERRVDAAPFGPSLYNQRELDHSWINLRPRGTKQTHGG